MSKPEFPESAMRVWDFVCECGHGRWKHYSYDPNDTNPRGREERNKSMEYGRGPCSDPECSKNKLCKRFKQAKEKSQ